jgi:hypothetical protein
MTMKSLDSVSPSRDGVIPNIRGVIPTGAAFQAERGIFPSRPYGSKKLTMTGIHP